jgi:hypothetical protein
MSNTGATLLLMVLLLGLAGYFVLVPPVGFEAWGHRLAIPLVLLVGAFTLFESLRMRAHVAQLRNLTGQALGEAAEPWEEWWDANRAKFGAPGAP